MAASQLGFFNLLILDANGSPAVGGRVYTYTQGTTTNKTAYTDAAAAVPHTYTSDGAGGQYIALNARGELPAPLFGTTGAYDIHLKTSAGATVWTRRADPMMGVASLSGSDGSSFVGHMQSGTGAVATTVQQQLRNIQSWDINVKDAPFYAVGNANYLSGGVWYEDAAHTIPATDDTAAINAAIAAFPAQGTPTWRPWVLGFPPGQYLISSVVNFKNQQGSVICGYGANLVGSFNATMLQVGDTSGNNDMLWAKVLGLGVEQHSTGVSANAVVAQHCYSCHFTDSKFYGGQYVFVLDGNANLVDQVTFRSGITANVLTATTSNNEVNTFQSCSIETSAGYGVDLQVNAGIGGFTNILGCYFEANASGNIRAKNNSMFRISDNYFNLQNLAAGVILDGTVGASYPDGYGVIENNRILGHASSSSKFIYELTGNSINCSYQNNKVESGVVDLYSSAPRSINLRRKRKQSWVTNKDSLPVVANAIVGWTNGGGPTLTNVTAFSQYGQAAAVAISGAGAYTYQLLTVPAASLIRVSVWGKSSDGVTVAGLQLWSAGLGGQYVTGPTTVSTAGVLLEAYLDATTRTSATTFILMLRNVSGAGTAQFCDIEVEDMTV